MFRLISWEINNRKKTIILSILLLTLVFVTLYLSVFSVIFWNSSYDQIKKDYARDNIFVIPAYSVNAVQEALGDERDLIKTFDLLEAAVSSNSSPFSFSFLDISSADAALFVRDYSDYQLLFGRIPTVAGEVMLTQSTAQRVLSSMRETDVQVSSISDLLNRTCPFDLGNGTVAEWIIVGIRTDIGSGLFSSEPNWVFLNGQVETESLQLTYRYVIFPSSLEKAGELLELFEKKNLTGLVYLGHYHQYAFLNRIYQFGSRSFRIIMTPLVCAFLCIIGLFWMKTLKKNQDVWGRLKLVGGNKRNLIGFSFGLFGFVTCISFIAAYPLILGSTLLLESAIRELTSISYSAPLQYTFMIPFSFFALINVLFYIIVRIKIAKMPTDFIYEASRK